MSRGLAAPDASSAGLCVVKGRVAMSRRGGKRSQFVGRKGGDGKTEGR